MAKATKTKTATPCICFTSVEYKFDASDPNAESGTDTAYGACGALTLNEFAPGHDAKLKGLLIKLHLQGLEYHRLVGGMMLSSDPLDVANERGWGHFLRTASDRQAIRNSVKIERAVAAQAKRETQAAAKAAKAAKAAADKAAAKANIDPESGQPRITTVEESEDRVLAAPAKPVRRSRKAATK